MRDSYPDFVIVGAMKAGTTSVAFQLRSHAQVAMPDREMNHFRGQGLGDLDKYRQLLEADRTEQTRIVGEKSPSYAYSPDVPDRIFEQAPRAKLIWCFRNPIDRTYSHYLHNVQRGREWRSFEHFLKAEWTGRAARQRRYMDRSRYAIQVERYLRRFPLEQMHFVVFERYVQDNLAELLPVLRFLGVEETGFVPAVEPKNQTIMPRSALLQYVALQLAKVRPRRGRFTEKQAKAIRAWFQTGMAPGYAPMLPSTRARLAEEFRPHNQRLADLTGLDLSVWDEPV